jgi:hypothetical protein
MTRYETLQIILTAFILAAAIIAACIYGCQLSEMQKSTLAATKAAKAAEDSVVFATQNAHLDQRAWMALASVSGAPNVGEPFRVTITIRNTGKTPAKKVRIVPVVDPRPDGSPPDFEKKVEETAKSYESGPYGIVSNAVVPPSATSGSTITASKGPLTAAGLETLKGQQRVFVYGKITYEDIFGVSHWVTFCNVLMQTEAGGWEYMAYSAYNDADNNV